MSIRRKYISDTAVLFGTSLVSQVIGFLVIPLFIQNIGAEMYGLYAISGLLMGYVNLADFGLTRGLTREIGHSYAAGDYERMGTAVSGGLLVLLLVGVVSFSIIFFSRYFIIDLVNVPDGNVADANILLIVTACFSLLAWPLKLPLSILQGNQKLKLSGMIEAYKNAGSSVTLFGCLFITTNLGLIRASTFFVMATALLPYIFVIRRYIPELRLRFSLRKVKEIKPVMNYGLKYFYSRLLELFSTKLATFIIGASVGLVAVAAYQIVFKIQYIVTLISMNLFGAFAPAVYRFDNDNERDKLQKLLDEALRYRVILMAPLVSVLIAVSPAFITLWVGKEFEQYGIWAQVYLILQYSTLFGLGATVIRASDNIYIANRIALIRAIINLGLSLWLVQYFGIGGPILGVLISHLLLGDLVCFPYYCKKSSLRWKRSFIQGLIMIVLTVPVTLSAIFAQQYWPIESWLTLFVYSAVSGVTMVIIILAFYGTKHDWDLAFSYYRNLKKFIKKEGQHA